ncbi:MAG TPA: hypothetical protein VF501_07995 [Thiobacillus sp.]
MLCLIPYLFPSARLLETAAQDLRLPALQTLLARGNRQPCPAKGVEAALCEALGITRQQDWPLAPITLEADGGVAGDAYWLRADPVHLRVMRDRIVLTDCSALDLSQREADALAATISRHFGTELSPAPLRPQRWYVRLPHAPRLTTTSLSVAVGRDIDPLLPQGADAMHYRARLNELQMLLHDHPVNLAREARGALPVNSLWLWGGGSKPAVPATRLSIYSCNDEARALGAFCNAAIHPFPLRWEKSLLDTESVVLLDSLAPAGQCGDPYGWREAIRVLEENWFEPLLGSLRTLGGPGVHLADPVSGKALHLQRADLWKVWRRPRSLISMLA